MTFCKQLASKERDGTTITAWEKTDKYSSVPYYQITISRHGIGAVVIDTARTTWKKKFNSL